MISRTEELDLTPDTFQDMMDGVPEIGPGDKRILAVATAAGHLVASQSTVVTAKLGPEIYFG